MKTLVTQRVARGRRTSLTDSRKTVQKPVKRVPLLQRHQWRRSPWHLYAFRGFLRGSQGYNWRFNNWSFTPIPDQMRRELEIRKLKIKGFKVYTVKGRHHRECSVCKKDNWVNGDLYVYPFPYVDPSDKYCLDCAVKKHCTPRTRIGRKCSICKQHGHNSRTCNFITT